MRGLTEVQVCTRTQICIDTIALRVLPATLAVKGSLGRSRLTMMSSKVAVGADTFFMKLVHRWCWNSQEAYISEFHVLIMPSGQDGARSTQSAIRGRTPAHDSHAQPQQKVQQKPLYSHGVHDSTGSKWGQRKGRDIQELTRKQYIVIEGKGNAYTRTTSCLWPNTYRVDPKAPICI